MLGDRDEPAGRTTIDAPLSGVRVVDFSRVLAGPFATMILSDLGADAVKVERPVTGDDTRRSGPPFIGEDAAYFLSVNRNKRSVVLDLSTADGRRAARDMAMRADVVVENFRPGLMASFGLDYASLASLDPSLVYCSLVAFSAEGEGSAKPGYDIMFRSFPA